MRLYCEKIEWDELPYRAVLTLDSGNKIYGAGTTIQDAIRRIESLSGIEIDHWHEYTSDHRGYDICLHCRLSRGDIDAMRAMR